MIKYTQSKVSIKNSDGVWVSRGNCFQTTIACLLEIPPTEVPNVETLFDMPESPWYSVMWQFLKHKGYELCTDDRYKVFHDESYGLEQGKRDEWLSDLKDKLYLVSGKSPRGINHVCVFQNGKMIWDCHPSREGILTQDYFESLDKI